MLKILIFESREIVLEHLRSLLAGQSFCEIVETTMSKDGWIDFLRSESPLDIGIAGWNSSRSIGLEWLSEAKNIRPELPLLTVGNISAAEQIRQVFFSGASGYILSTIGREELLFAIRHLVMGGEYISSQLGVDKFKLDDVSVTKILPVTDKDYSAAELRLLQAISDGLNSKDIGDMFFLSRRSIESRRAGLLAKVGVKNTAALIKYAAMRGLVS